MSELVRGLTDPSPAAAAAAGGAGDGPQTRRIPRASPRSPRSHEARPPPTPPDHGRPASQAGPLRSTTELRRPRWLLLAAAVAVAAAAAVLVQRPWRRGESEPAAPAPSVSTAAPAPPRSEEPARSAVPPRSEEAAHRTQPVTVAIDLDSQPSGAEVFIGGERRGTTPLKLALERRTAPVPILLRHGRDEVRRELDVSGDARLVVAFPAAARSQPAPRPRAPSAPTSSPIPAEAPAGGATSAAGPAPPSPPPPSASEAPPAASAPLDAAVPPRGLDDNLMQPRQRP